MKQEARVLHSHGTWRAHRNTPGRSLQGTRHVL